MQKSLPATVLVLAVVGLIAAPAHAVKPPETPKQAARGKAIYEHSCLLCHGAIGQGDGPAAFFIASYGAPRPQNLRSGNFKFRSTPYGILPTDDDLFRTLTRGVAGFMPPFRGLSEEQRWAIIYYIKSFNPRFRDAKPEKAEIRIGEPSLPSPGHLAIGRRLYEQAGCSNCHGVDGQGDGPQAATLKDYRGFPIQPADLTRPTAFKNGSKPEDVYRTIMTGLSGTPMISFAPVFSGRKDQVWHLVHYILSLSER